MTALLTGSNFSQMKGGEYYPVTDSYPVAAAVKILKGGMVGLFAGLAKSGVPVAAGSPEIIIIGRAEGTGSNGTSAITTVESDVDNTAGAAGDKWVRVTRGVFLMKNSAGVEALTITDTGKPCYLVDDITVSKNSNNSKRPRAGIVFAVVTAAESGTAAGVYVQIGAPTFERITTTRLAGADLTLHQFGIVKLAASKVVKAAATTDALYGVLQNAPNTNDVAEIVMLGPSFVKAGAANVTTSVDIGSDANGLAIDLVSTKRLLGQSEEGILAGALGMAYIRPGGSIA